MNARLANVLLEILVGIIMNLKRRKREEQKNIECNFAACPVKTVSLQQCMSCIWVLSVSCAKIKRKKSLFGTAIYVEVTVDGESRRTAKSHSSSSPKWDETLLL